MIEYNYHRITKRISIQITPVLFDFVGTLLSVNQTGKPDFLAVRCVFLIGFGMLISNDRIERR